MLLQKPQSQEQPFQILLPTHLENKDCPAAFTANAALSAYIVMSGIYFVLGIAILVGESYHRTNGGIWIAMLCLICGGLWVLWLRGFRIRIQNGIFEYRDGFYRTHSCKLDEIKSTRAQWISWRFLWRALKVPRMIVNVTDPNAEPILINTKPFSRTSLASFRDLIDRK